MTQWPDILTETPKMRRRQEKGGDAVKRRRRCPEDLGA
jgi:hypothetical protein